MSKKQTTKKNLSGKATPEECPKGRLGETCGPVVMVGPVESKAAKIDPLLLLKEQVADLTEQVAALKEQVEKLQKVVDEKVVHARYTSF